MSLKTKYTLISAETHNDEKDWLRKRKIATYISIMFGFLLGMEYSGMIVSLPFYLRDTLHIKNSKLYYSIITTAMSLSAAVSGIVFGRFLDNTRNLRFCLLVFPFLGLIGNLIYTLHYSVWLLLLGRLFCGLSDAAQPAISGEFSRLYKGNELTSVLGRYQAVYSIGFVIGPATAILFKPINCTIGTWQLNQNNFIGIFLAMMLSLFMIAVFFGVSNLDKLGSKQVDEDQHNDSENEAEDYQSEDDNHQHQESEKETVFSESKVQNPHDDSVNDVDCSYKEAENDQKDCENKADSHNQEAESSSMQTPNKLMSLNDILGNSDIMLVVLTSALSCSVASSIELLINITASSLYHWSLLHLSIVTAIGVVLYAVVMLPFSGVLIGHGKRIYILYIMCFIVPCVAMVLLMLSKRLYSASGGNVAIETTTIAIILMVNIFTGISAPVLARRLLFQLVPSHSGSFAEGVRGMFSRILSVFGFFTAAFMFPAMEVCMPIIIALFLIIAFALIARKNNFYKAIN